MAMQSPPETGSTSDGEARLGQRLSEIETRIEKLAERFDQLEFVIVEQFEPGMSGTGDLPSGNLRDRLDRIESVLGLLSQGAEEQPVAAPAAVADAPVPAGIERRETFAARLEEVDSAQSIRADAAEARLDGMTQALDILSAEARGRHQDLRAAFEKAMNRPPPAPDMTMQHRSFAGFATALQVTRAGSTMHSKASSLDLERLPGASRRSRPGSGRTMCPRRPPNPSRAISARRSAH
jgi:hypothetical protein